MAMTIMMLIGAPAVGKTSFATKMADTFTKSTLYQFLHVNYDKMMPDRDYADSAPTQWKSDRLALFHQVEIFLQQLRCSDVNTALWTDEPVALTDQQRLVIIIDDNMYYRSMRHCYYRLAQTYGCGYCQVYFQATLEEALRANNSRESKERVSQIALKNIMEKMDAPKKNSWEKNTITVPGFSNPTTILNDLQEMLEYSFLNPECLLSQQDRPSKTNNDFHDADLFLRKLVGKTINLAKEKLTKHRLLTFTHVLAQHKVAILSDFKSSDQPTSMEYLEMNFWHSVSTLLESFDL